MTFHNAAFVVLALFVGYAAYSDVRFRRLPNLLCLILAICGLAYAGTVQQQHDFMALAAPAPFYSNIIHAAIALVAGMVLFAMRWIGAGDAKFYAAVATWFPLGKAGFLLVAVSTGGLVLVLCWFVLRRLAGHRVRQQTDEIWSKFPYGLAISSGALLAFLA